VLRYEAYRHLKELGFSSSVNSLTLSAFEMRVRFCHDLAQEARLYRVENPMTNEVTLTLPDATMDCVRMWENYELIT
jgi:hypothetical protein